MTRSRGKLISVGHLEAAPRWRMAAHGHRFHEMIVIVRGRLLLTCRSQQLRAGMGDVLLYPSGLRHAEETDPDDPVESYFAAFDMPSLAGRDPRLTHDHNGRIREIIRWLYADQGSDDAHALVARAALLQAMVAEFARTDVEHAHALVADIRRFVREHLDEPLNLEGLARRAGLSRYHFLRTYRRLSGHTPMQDVRGIRVAFARNALITTMMPLKEIAARSGLGSEYAFSRTFRREVGVPPGEYRRAYGTRGE